jgi:hypothetical protein
MRRAAALVTVRLRPAMRRDPAGTSAMSNHFPRRANRIGARRPQSRPAFVIPAPALKQKPLDKCGQAQGHFLQAPVATLLQYRD